jgi:hypothetical protein
MGMQELLASQVSSMIKLAGFDPEETKAQVAQVVNDIHAMKLSQERTEAMVLSMYNRETVIKYGEKVGSLPEICAKHNTIKTNGHCGSCEDEAKDNG